MICGCINFWVSDRQGCHFFSVKRKFYSSSFPLKFFPTKVKTQASDTSKLLGASNQKQKRKKKKKKFIGPNHHFPPCIYYLLLAFSSVLLHIRKPVEMVLLSTEGRKLVPPKRAYTGASMKKHRTWDPLCTSVWMCFMRHWRNGLHLHLEKGFDSCVLGGLCFFKNKQGVVQRTTKWVPSHIY